MAAKLRGNGRHPVWFAFIRWLVKQGYFQTHGGLFSINESNMPRSGPVIVAPNHLSHLDPPAVACGSRRRMRFMAKEELFDHPIFGRLIWSLGAYPVRRGAGDTESIRKTISLLEEGEAVLVFPEGTRGDGETLNPINKGVAMFAKRTNAPVIPVGVVGTHLVMPRGKSKGQKHRMTIIYGTPFTYKEVTEGHPDKEARERFTAHLESEIRKLCASQGLNLKSALPEKGQASLPDSEPTP